MEDNRTDPPECRGKRDSHLSIAALFVLALALASFIMWGKPWVQTLKPEPAVFSGGTTAPRSTLPLDASSVGPLPSHNARVTNVQIVDFDGDGQQDVVACDVQRNGVFWYGSASNDSWDEHVIADDLNAPAHATIVDLDQRRKMGQVSLFSGFQPHLKTDLTPFFSAFFRLWGVIALPLRSLLYVR